MTFSLIKILSGVMAISAMEQPKEAQTMPEGLHKWIIYESMLQRQVNNPGTHDSAEIAAILHEEPVDTSPEPKKRTKEELDKVLEHHHESTKSTGSESTSSTSESEEEEGIESSQKFLKEFFIFDEVTFNEARVHAGSDFDKVWNLLMDNHRQRIITVDHHNISSSQIEDVTSYNFEALRQSMRRHPHSLEEINQSIRQNEQLQRNCQDSLNHLIESFKSLEEKRKRLIKRQRDTAKLDEKLRGHHAIILKLTVRFLELKKERDQYNMLQFLYDLSVKKTQQYAQEESLMEKIKMHMKERKNTEIKGLIEGYETRKKICKEALQRQNQN